MCIVDFPNWVSCMCWVSSSRVRGVFVCVVVFWGSSRADMSMFVVLVRPLGAHTYPSDTQGWPCRLNLKGRGLVVHNESVCAHVTDVPVLSLDHGLWGMIPSRKGVTCVHSSEMASHGLPVPQRHVRCHHTGTFLEVCTPCDPS